MSETLDLPGRICLSQQERRASESLEDTEARHKQERECHMTQRDTIPLLEQPAVRLKIRNFIIIAAVYVSRCITCLVCFPGFECQNDIS